MPKKASIMIIVLFLLFVSAIIILLISNYFFSILQMSSEVRKYYKSYRLANAWIEIEKYKLYNHYPWFEEKILSGSNTIKNNLECSSCYFQTIIRSKSLILGNENSLDATNCVDDIYLQLWPGQWVIIPLYWENIDSNIENSALSLGSVDTYNWNIEIYSSGFVSDTFLAAVIDKNLNKFVKQFNINNFSQLFEPTGIFDDEKYFVLVNQGAHTNYFCARFGEKIPSYFYKIYSYWKFIDRAVWLEFEYTKKIPEFFIYNVIY